MADFVAVIRRAVDGLSDNNAEMRQKVYEKARGAVRRQLESMNPRPSDELMKRQLDKLEAAIGDVETEHAEALPAEEPVEALPVEEETVAVVEPEPQPVETEPEEHVEPAEEAVPAVEEEPVAEPVAEAEPVVADEPVHEEPIAEEPAFVEEPAVEEPVAEEPVAEESVVHEEVVAVEAHTEPSWQVEAEPAEDYVPSWHEPEQAAAAADVHPELPVEPEQQVYPVHDAVVPEAEPVADARMPASEAEWDWQEAVSVTTPAEKPEEAVPADDPLAWEWPDEKATRSDAAQAAPARTNEWGDLEDLIGFTPKTAAGVAAATTPAADAGLAAAAAEPARAPQRSFRAEPRKSRFSLAALAATVAVLAVVGGAGAAYWFNRDAVNGWVDARIASFTTPSEKPVETSKAGDTAEGSRSLPANAGSGTGEAAGKGNGTEVASASPASGGKFTQRLLEDGSEVDEGPAPALDGASEEGKSVSAQTTADAGGAAAGATEGAAQTPAGGETATTTGAGTTAAASGDQAAAGVAQKMFLYEERLGQTSPTAIEGTVAWSTAEESPGGDAKPEPVVRAQINVPSKGLTALITFRRNTDKSLPASHIVELVFSLPENFEGGGIESVQRVAMKRTEQDRGDALIAVPAKITDDFHMIALNDFPEAIAKNTELLRTRSWIDIPITYRNGRRALLTLDKGKAGAEAFDKVMKAWASLGGGAANR